MVKNRYPRRIYFHREKYCNKTFESDENKVRSNKLGTTQSATTCSKLTIETLGQGATYVHI